MIHVSTVPATDRREIPLLIPHPALSPLHFKIKMMLTFFQLMTLCDQMTEIS